MATTDDIGSIGAAVGEFAALAARGGFAVNDHGGQSLLTAIRNMVAWVDDNMMDLRQLDQTAKLGTSTNAEVMKPYLRQVASDSAGFLTQLDQLRVSLLDAEAAIRQAMANYQSVDQQVAGQLS
ncbi:MULTISPECIES: hypothetical protein [Actinokineospora]|uniref:Uncharacterized protein n=2 Tax=Actinokineospora TaxID=39845 RepID=A0A421AVD6_9PSEU|nr:MULTISPECIES: hypothetical protein [Actinokineospora]RLK53706.1 hypothetical protein CLV68_6629 [Actinokineospora cianjurensis]SES39014.1 hypothetical protein SAMN04487818_11214 [Actinokineospora terrae]